MIDKVNLTLTQGLLYYVGQFTILIDTKNDYLLTIITTIIIYTEVAIVSDCSGGLAISRQRE